jgi:hypothetical protein
MHDYLKRRFGRRTILKGAAAGALAAAAGPVFWRQSSAWASNASAPQWIAYGADPTRQMHISWSSGTYNGTNPAPPAPQVRWGRDRHYGARQSASATTVPIPSNATGEPIENTIYLTTRLDDLHPGTTYHYSVSNDGKTWSPDVIFTTAFDGATDFRFVAFGDESTTSTSSQPMAQLVSQFKPAFTVVAGDLSYASGGVLLPPGGGPAPSFSPGAWDAYLGIVGPAAAQSIPWQVGVGNHEMEPLTDNGYAGFVTRFPQPYETTSGSPVTHAFTYGNVAFIGADGNDLSAEISNNNGYTAGAQTTWLESKLAQYRHRRSGIDFIVVYFHNCMFCTNQTHGSDGGIRSVWEPLFDQYHVDLVINGHVHAYERTYPIIAGQPTKVVPPGGTVEPAKDGTTYICCGGGGQSLYTTWYSTSGQGDAGSGAPQVWEWSAGDSANGGTGTANDVADTALDYSAYRLAVWNCIVVDVTAPTFPGGRTSMHIRAVDPTQTVSGGISTIAHPAVMDRVTLTRESCRDRDHWR